MAVEQLLTYRPSLQIRQAESSILLQEHNFRRMNERINGNASDGGVELRQGNNIFLTLRTDINMNIRTISFKYPNDFYLSRKFPSPSDKYQICSTCRQGVSKVGYHPFVSRMASTFQRYLNALKT